ncbi:uncharacterized protein LOC121994670 [Zingiber officinale]|uniref:uncharacterized protein LOC121994670 n=1 Tax=Zingiber officinale TaxID=94328 RepID=UPI001C4AA8B1|nr:uncharacterized protein LOC121994670 [Zingiber officinale]
MDIVGPFPMATGQRKYLLVVVDYFFKWVEVEPLVRITEQMSNGQAKVANREILRILHVRLDHMGGNWVDELSSVLWEIRTTPKERTGATPFHLVYDGEAVAPVEVGVESDRIKYYDEDNAERRLLELDLVDEAHAKAAIRLMSYRQRMRQNYNRRVIPRSFQVGDFVWNKVKPVGDVTKLEAPWAGPFRIVEKLRSGAYYLEDEDRRRLEHPWSANHLQSYRAG